jgi:DNA-3-methyladenine glycosylase
MKYKVLPNEFFNRSSVVVAKDLLGKFLVRKYRNKIEKFMITETEAYEGKEDKASHAHRGQTKRNTPMFGEPGTIYVYFTYGMHWMLNIVCGKRGYPSAVLIRGVEALSGPARLTKRLKIDKKLNNKMFGKKSGLLFEEVVDLNKKLKISRTPRIGIDRSGPVWSKKLYRFVIK